MTDEIKWDKAQWLTTAVAQMKVNNPEILGGQMSDSEREKVLQQFEGKETLKPVLHDLVKAIKANGALIDIISDSLNLQMEANKMLEASIRQLEERVSAIEEQLAI